MTYRFVQGIDYGPRSGTLGISLHMSEGGDGLADGFLARKAGEDLWQWADRVNGVSCNAAILSTGEVVKMLDDNHASGNLNPDDRAGEYGYYGGSHLRAVLGAGWTNPNEWTLSIELAGFRAAGPTDAQVASTIRLCNEWKVEFPTIRGATGHHDQSPKGCPGLTPNMKAIFAGIGGHGLWTTTGGSDVRFANSNGYSVTSLKRLSVKAGQLWTFLDGSAGGGFSKDATVDCLGLADSKSGAYLVEIATGKPYVDGITRSTVVMVKTAALPVDVPPPAPVDCTPLVTAAVTKERERVKAAATIASTKAIGGVS